MAELIRLMLCRLRRRCAGLTQIARGGGVLVVAVMLASRRPRRCPLGVPAGGGRGEDLGVRIEDLPGRQIRRTGKKSVQPTDTDRCNVQASSDSRS